MKISTIVKGIEEIDRLERNGTIGEPERNRRETIRKKVAFKLNIEAISWRQKAREKWSKERDRNTTYFHYLANFSRKRNYIEEFIDNDRAISGNVEMRGHAKEHFTNLCNEEIKWRPSLDNLQFKSL